MRELPSTQQKSTLKGSKFSESPIHLCKLGSVTYSRCKHTAWPLLSWQGSKARTACRLSSGVESPITAGDANRPLAARGMASESSPEPQSSHSGARARPGEPADPSAGNDNGEVSCSGRPEQLTCRLLVDCMVGPTLPLHWISLSLFVSWPACSDLREHIQTKPGCIVCLSLHVV